MAADRNLKKYKQGESITRENDKASSVFYINTGSVSQCVVREKKRVDLFQVNENQVIGENALSNNQVNMTSAIAVTDVDIIEISADELKGHIAGCHPMVKMLLASNLEKLNHTLGDLIKFKTENPAVPCPPDQVAKVFGAMFFAITQKADKRKDGTYSIDWQLFKSYCRRVFSESPVRIEQAANILVKLKVASYEIGKSPNDPKGPDSIQRFQVLDITALDNFFELYQHYYFKPGKTEILNPDEISFELMEVIVEEGLKMQPDKMGAIMVDYKILSDKYKEKTNLALTPAHLAALESKGLFHKRRQFDGVKIEFDLPEYKGVLNLWKIINEINKWNSKGYVDLKEEKKVQKKELLTNCPNCKAALISDAKFCHACGFKIS